MRPRLKTWTLGATLAVATLLAGGPDKAQAQLVVAKPGVSVGVGVPAVGMYPAYGVAPAYGAVYCYPVARPYPYVYRPGPVVYGPRMYGPYYRARGPFRRW